MTYDIDQYLTLAKIESTEGTDAEPAIADAVLCVGKPQWTPLAANYGDRDYVDGRSGAKPQFIGAPHGLMTLNTDLTAGGDSEDLDALPQWTALLRACGFAATLTADTKVDFTPVSAAYPSATIRANIDRVDGAILGARGNCVISGSAGQVPQMAFSLMGIRTAIAAADPESGSLPDFAEGLPISAGNTTVSIGGTSLCVNDFSIDCGRSPTFDDLAGCRTVRINRRRMSGRLTLDMPDLATKNLIEEAAAETLQAVVITHGTADGSVVVLTMPKVQLKPGVFSDRDGLLSLPLDLQITPSGSEDDITITTR